VLLKGEGIFCCVDRPWPRAVLNCLAYSDLIPVIDGGIAIDTFGDSTMRGATWRTHVITSGRPCMSCNRQLDMGLVALDVQGLLDDPEYIRQMKSDASCQRLGQNVAPLSMNVAAALLSQYVSFSVAPGGFGDPGPLQYVLATHHLEHLDAETSPHCVYEPAEPPGDSRQDLTGPHAAAARHRGEVAHVPPRIRLLRLVDDGLTAVERTLDRLG
jgi:molybdopterin-synthase adenylyltransferase